MNITSLVLKNNRVQVFADDAYVFSCTQNFIIDNRLYVDLELTQEELKIIKEKAQYCIVEFKLFEYAIRRIYSQKELERKVSNYCFKKYNFFPEAEFLQEAIAKAERLHFYDTKTVIKNLCSKYISRGKGKTYIFSKLLSKGFEKPTITEIIAELNKENIDENLKKLIDKKYSLIINSDLKKFELKQKLIKFAMAKGYGYVEVKKYIEEILS